MFLSFAYQFKKTANIYFVLIILLRALPWSPVSPLVLIVVLGLIFMFSMIKELVEVSVALSCRIFTE